MKTNIQLSSSNTFDMNFVAIRFYFVFLPSIIFCLIYSFSTSLQSQSITVSAKAEQQLDIDYIDVNCLFSEVEYDFEQIVYPDIQLPPIIALKDFLARLDSNHIQKQRIEFKEDKQTYYERSTKQQQVKTMKNTNYLLKIKSYEELELIKKLVNSNSNLKIVSADFNSKNEDITLRALTTKVLASAKLQADKMANLLDRKITTLEDIKVINMQTIGHPQLLMQYVLEQKAYLDLEVTYQTE